MGFHHREDELAFLEERWSSDRAEFLVVYGRRRVGKSYLIAHFAEGRRHLLYEATAGSERDQLEDIGKELARVSGSALHAAQPPTSWRAVFAAFEELLAGGRLLIALDEFQFVARRNPEVGSLINRFLRQHAGDDALRLLVSGSDVSFFESDVMGYSAVTYGRRTGSLRLEPFRWADIGAFLPGWSVDDRIRAWAAFGGMPYYLAELDPSASLAENLLRTVLSPGSVLRDEPRFLLSQESRIRDADTYLSILRAIANGQTRSAEIAGRVGRPADELRSFLQNLERMQLVRRRYPVPKTRGNKVIYAIADPFLRFWFRFVAPYESRLQTRAAALRHLEQTILPELDHFVSGDAYEEICRDWAMEAFPHAVDVGRWWGNRKVRTPDGPRNRQYEADVVPFDADGRILALGSCKWSGGDHDAAELDKLETIRTALAKDDLLADDAVPLLFFDRSGFSERLRQLAGERDDVRLVTTAGLDRGAGA